MVGCPLRMGMVSLSTSKESRTAARAPPGQLAGVRSRPALTAFTVAKTRSSLHRQPGSSSAWGDWAAPAVPGPGAQEERMMANAAVAMRVGRAFIDSSGSRVPVGERNRNNTVSVWRVTVYGGDVET